MSFRASLLAADLAAAAHRAAAIARSPIVPVLAHALLRFESRGLLIAGTDGDQSIGSHVDAKGEGVATVNATSLAAFARRLKQSEPVKLSLEKSGMLAVIQGSARADLPYLSPNDLPLNLGVGGGVDWPMPAKIFEDALSRVAGAMDHNPTRAYLNGVSVDLSGPVPYLVATCGAWLAAEPLIGVDVPEFRSRSDLIIPREAIPHFQAIAKGVDEIVLTLADYAVGAVAGNSVFRTKLVDGRFVDWRRVIPRRSSTTVQVDREALIDAFDLIFSIDSGTAVLSFGDKGLEISGGSYSSFAKSNAAVAARQVVPIEKMEGPPVRNGFNSEHLSNAFASLPDAKLVEFCLGESGDIVTIRDPARDEKCIRALMPIRMRAQAAA